MAGMLIVLEGCDLSGKSQQRNAVADALEAKGYEVTRTREPGGTPFAERMRQHIFDHKGQMSQMAELMAFQAARADHIDRVIIPHLEQGKIVITDRFFLSTWAHQVFPYTSEANTDLLQVFGETMQPLMAKIGTFMTFFLDVPKSVREQRRLAVQGEIATGERNTFDEQGEARAQAVEQAYEILRTNDDVVLIDGNRSPEEVTAEIVKLIDDGLIERDQLALSGELKGEAQQEAQGQAAEKADLELPPFDQWVEECIVQNFAQQGLPMLLHAKRLNKWKSITQRKCKELRKEIEADGKTGQELYAQINHGVKMLANLAYNHEMAEQMLNAKAPSKVEKAEEPTTPAEPKEA